MPRFNQVYQFKITLKGTKPPIWRRIQVPETCSFYELHVAIQDAMGWSDMHLHDFTINKPPTMRPVEIGVPDEEWDSGEVLKGWTQKIAKYFSESNKTALYLYDFGDGWEHTIAFEGIYPKDPSLPYPRCLAGKRACPPEDCGGPWAFRDLLEGDHPMQEEYADFDPATFDPKQVEFGDPKARLEFAKGFLYPGET